MNSSEAASFAYNKLREHGLGAWTVRLSKLEKHSWFLGLCDYKNKCIIINGFHVEMHGDAETKCTILHEVAHALTPGHGHDDIWAAKAREIGCDNTNACSHLSLSPNIIDAIRSGADVEVEVTETVHTNVVREVKHKISRIQEYCTFKGCGKVAEEVSSKLVECPNEDLKIIYLKCGHILTRKIPKGTPFKTLRSIDGFKPYPFQLEGMQFLEKALAQGKGGAIFDEMGLGKTVQALGYINFHKSEVTPTVFVVKSGIVYQWLREIYRWTGEVAQIIERSTDICLPMFDYYIISYDLMIPKVKKLKSGKLVHQGFDAQKLIDRGVKLVVLDECQQIKNIDSSRTQQVKKLVRNTKVIALSGTPWKNRGSEFFSVLNMLDPIKFPSYAAYLTKWIKYYAHGNQWKEGGINNVAQFREYISEIAIRREVDEVMKEMPEVNRTIFSCNLDEFQQKEYDDEVTDFVNKIKQRQLEGTDDNIAAVIGDLQRMRHITGLAKIPVVVEWCKEFVEETDRKLVIFAHHVDVQELLYLDLKNQKEFKDIPILQFTGTMNPLEKSNVAELFNKTQRCIMVASTLAAGEGVNLQTCADGILMEPQWNPANEDQAAPGRFRRIGQTKNMNVVRIVARGTIDEMMATLIEQKRQMFHVTMNKGEMITWDQGSLIKDLISMIVKSQNKKKKAS